MTSPALRVVAIAPGASLQDQGRVGGMALGVSRSGAADLIALHEGAALLSQPPGCAALEMPGAGGRFEVLRDIVVALTGASMPATCDGAALAWNASHHLRQGTVLEIGGARGGTYGYLHIGAGFDGPQMLGSRSQHVATGLFPALTAGAVLYAGTQTTKGGLTLDPADRWGGGTLRILPGFQTGLFPQDQQVRFASSAFRRDVRANRMGVRLIGDGDGFGTASGLSVLSEIVVPGDVQITGDGTPFILLNECQTTGGYPRIGTVLPCDLPRVAQAPAGAMFSFAFVTLDEAVSLDAAYRAHLAALPRQCRARIRDPHDIPDLLSYQLIGGVTAGDD
ncbi:biotin-dependent carboxyltransferase family protein [Pseudoprimorskyibacter insulae]|uniref:KipI antagonist n=1 Tax=Pseudoprimorskyibacter insulae TaxID=1695997 RepID=A0A2R8AQN3_9RHOB|nr:urea amidolyase [Pseudoprimorskyibacter insulae]SPF78134.1 KipI antagonist [Pseudoprimorskyibacter insulae]